MLLGVNIDHIAVLREARRINDPDPLDALSILKFSGADQVTIHLREDRRHINDLDAAAIIKHSCLPVNLECAAAKEMVDIITTLQPHRITLVPEKREEVTTEGGLNLETSYEKIKHTICEAQKYHIETSLFIDPDEKQVRLAKELGANWIEFHTGEYANIYAMLYTNLSSSWHSITSLELPRDKLTKMLQEAIKRLEQSAVLANSLGLKVAAGHGLNYHNVKCIAQIEHIEELNIGQSIIARSVFTGLSEAIKQMKALL